MTAPTPWDRDPPQEPHALVLGPGLPMPPILLKPENPNSAGLYPLGRKYSVGDEFVFRVHDTMTGGLLSEGIHTVTQVDAASDRVYLDGGDVIYDSMGNWIRQRWSGRQYDFAEPKQMAPAELQVGRKWRAAYRMLENGVALAPSTVDYQITSREPVTVPGGRFDAFRIEGRGFTTGNPLQETIWVMPWLNFPVRYIRRLRGRTAWAPWLITERHDLVSLRQLAVDSTAVR